VQRDPHRLFELARYAVLAGPGPGDEVGEDLAVGLRSELGALRDQPRAQLLGVLDDAVVHDGDRPTDVRVCVLVAGLAVGRPPGVPDARAALQPGRNVCGELGDSALGLPHPQVAAPADNCQASRVVTAVLKPGQALQQDRYAVAAADVRHNSAQSLFSYRSLARPYPYTIRRSCRSENSGGK
jgi:hypothetical protein